MTIADQQYNFRGTLVAFVGDTPAVEDLRKVLALQ